MPARAKEAVLSMNVMQAYIDEQPAVLSRLLTGWPAQASRLAQYLDGRPVRRVILFGSGSSYHASVLAAPFWARALGVEATPAVPTRMDSLQGAAPDGLLCLAVSQGGRSTSTYHEIQALQARGIPVIAVTQSPDTPIGRQADLAFGLPIGEETIGAKTKGVTATAVTLILLALTLGAARGTADPGWIAGVRSGLRALVQQMPENIARSKRWAQAVCPVLAPARYLYVLGAGAAYGGALEGALKLLETTYRPVSCYEFEEYLHGVQNALDAHAYLLCLMPRGADQVRMRRLTGFAAGQGAHTFRISFDPADGRGDCDLVLAGGASPALDGMAYLPALQTLSAQVSAYCGIDVTTPRYPDFFSQMESKL